MELLAPTLQAVGLFTVTNIDDVIVLSLFYARGAGVPGTIARILSGQYLGFGAILAVAVLVARWARAASCPRISSRTSASFPIVLIGLGVVILVEGGVFGG